MNTADLAIAALTGLNFALTGCFYYRDKLLIAKLADRLQLPKAPAPSSSSAPKKGTDAALQPPEDSTRPISILGGESTGEVA